MLAFPKPHTPYASQRAAVCNVPMACASSAYALISETINLLLCCRLKQAVSIVFLL